MIDLPPKLWCLFRDRSHGRGRANDLFLWTTTLPCTPDNWLVLLAFTTRARAEVYADTVDDDTIVAREVMTQDLRLAVILAGGAKVVGLDADTLDAAFMPWDEFEAMAGAVVSVPVVVG